MRLSRPSDDRPVRKRVRRDRRDHDGAQRGMNDGPAAGERVGRRARRARDHEPVAAVRIDETAVDPDFELDHAPGFVPLHDDVVERAVRALGAVRGSESRAAATGVGRSRSGLPARRRRCASISSGRTSVRKPSRPRLTPSSGTPRAERELRREEHRAVAANRHDEVRLLPELARRACGRVRPGSPSTAASRSRNTVKSSARRVRRRAAPANRRLGRLRPCRPGRCGRSACSFGFAGFLARGPDRGPQSLTLDERDC